MKICTVEGCSLKHHSSGYCSTHYARFSKHGTTDKQVRKAHSKAREFLHLALSMECEECINWPLKRKNGYGQMTFRGKRTLPSRAMCFLAHGEPPTDKHEAAHSCGKGHEGCVNPRHLRWATSKENSEDCIRHGTVARGERSGSSKVTEDQARFMILNRGKIKQKTIAAMLGVPKPTVCQIQKGKSWKWLTEKMNQERETQQPQHHLQFESSIEAQP